MSAHPQDAKKLVDNVLGQLGAISGLPQSAQGSEVGKQIPTQVQKLITQMPILEEVCALRKSSTLTTEKQIKVYLADLADDLNESVDLVKVAKALTSK